MARKLVALAIAVAALVAACSSQSCPNVPLHCVCGVDPVCTNGQWVCECPDAGDAGAD